MSLINRPDRRVTQQLSSGLIVRQDISTASRFVFFNTGLEEFKYATHGGTLFIVSYKNKPYALTASHVFQDFSDEQLVVTDQRLGRDLAPISAVYRMSKPEEEAVGSDVLDVAVIEFVNDIVPSFFSDAPYLIEDATVGVSQQGDTLMAAGTLKGPSTITENQILPAYCRLEFLDDTARTNDPALRRAVAKIKNPEFDSLVGLSGSPVFNTTKNVLCGMVIRGGIAPDSGFSTMRYVDVRDIMQILDAVHQGKGAARYRKKITLVSQERYPS